MFVKKFYMFALIFLAPLFFVNLAKGLGKNGLYGETLCNDPGFHCLTVTETTVIKEIKTKKGCKKIEIKVPQTWAELWPDENEREIVMKINRLNIKLKAGMTLAVPNDLTAKTLLAFSPYEKKIEAPSKKLLIFDPNLLAWAAYDELGNLVRWGPAVGGKKGKLTVVGSFKIIKISGPKCRSGKYHAPMPWAMFFHPAGYAFHGSPNVPGQNASHGCVRLFNDDAEWLNKNFVEIGTKVIIRPYQE